MVRITLLCALAVTPAALAGACGGGNASTTPAATAPTGSDPYAAYYGTAPGAAPPGYAPTAAPGYAPGTAPGYAPTAAPGYAPGYAPTAAPTAPAPAAPMATPGPLALPCTNDGACILARCNMQYQKCAFPCQSAADCAANATCNAASGLCLPGGQ